jgi:hypothetical protein
MWHCCRQFVQKSDINIEKETVGSSQRRWSYHPETVGSILSRNGWYVFSISGLWLAKTSAYVSGWNLMPTKCQQLTRLKRRECNVVDLDNRQASDSRNVQDLDLAFADTCQIWQLTLRCLDVPTYRRTDVLTYRRPKQQHRQVAVSIFSNSNEWEPHQRPDISLDRVSAFEIFEPCISPSNGRFLISLIVCDLSEKRRWLTLYSSQAVWITAEGCAGRKTGECREFRIHENQKPMLKIFSFKQFQALSSEIRLNIWRQWAEPHTNGDQRPRNAKKNAEWRDSNIASSTGCPMNSWASERGIVSQLSRLEHQISLKESHFHTQWKKLKQQILERKRWKTNKKTRYRKSTWSGSISKYSN